MRWWAMAALCALTAGCGDGAQEAAHPGQQTYTRFCFSCHASGVAGAPKVGVPEAWATRVAKGRDALLAATVEGVPPGMPPRGLCSQCSDDELQAAIDYMLSQSEP